MRIKATHDNRDAREAAAVETNRITAKIRDLHAVGNHGEAEYLTLQMERADLDAETWGEAYLELRTLGH